MTSKELAEEIRSIITYLCEVSGKQDKYALKCCDELDKKLEVLDILKKYIRAGHWSNEYTLLSWEMKARELIKIERWFKND